MQKKPNIIFVLADQLGVRHCGYAGAEKAKTPNIDNFATEGVNFTNAVASSPVCSAYRASLFTGKYTTSTGMVINELRINPSQRCLGHVVTDANYETCYIGKWHLWANHLGKHDDPKNSFIPRGEYRLGFDGHWAAYNFHHDYYDTYYHLDTEEKISYGEGAYEPDAQTDMMIDWLKNKPNDDKPFCAVLSYGTPHDPWSDDNVPAEYREKFDVADFPNPPNYLPHNNRYADNWGILSPEQRELLPLWRRNYYAMTNNLDENFGRLLKEIEAQGLTENTIVVFSSDHGEMFGAHGRRAKNTFYEEAARIPLLVRWPEKIAKGTSSDACISSVDMMPTILGLMGLDIPDEVEGTDCSRLACGEGGPEPDAAFLQNTGAVAAWANGFEWRALRDKRYTYAIYKRDGSEWLYDNIEDPYQMSNLADDEGHWATMEKFRTQMAGKMESINDTFEDCTWYDENWIEDRCIMRTATLNA